MEQGAVDLGIPGLTDAVEVARGGFSTIYRATQRAMERTVAVKLIHATVVDPVAGEHFLREVRATGRLSQHPNVAPVYDVGTTASKQPYLIMPYYEHGSLQRHLDDSGALSEQAAVRLARTLASTLDYVHHRGILHRDIKPANVLLTEADEPLLADFGVARLVDGSVPVHTTGANVVTWAYGPPEAFTGGDPTPAWDIYSLGATVYAMLTGNPPFVDGQDVNVFTVLNRIGNVEVPDLRDRGVSAPVADAVRKTMAKDPSDRPESAAAFAALLARPLPPPRPAPVVEVVEAAPQLGAAEVEPEPVAVVEPEPVLEPERMAAVAAVGAIEHREAAEPVVISSPAPAGEPEAEPDAPAPAVQAAGKRGEAKRRGLLAVLALAAFVLSWAASSNQVYTWGGSEFEGGTRPDLGASLPLLVLLIGLPLVLARLGEGSEWLIGAGAALIALNFGWAALVLLDDSSRADEVGLVLRASAAGLLLVIIVLAWRSARVPGPRINGVSGAVLVIGAGLAIVGISDYVSKFGISELTFVIMAMVALLLVRGFAFPDRTTGAPALVAGGLCAALFLGFGPAYLVDPNGDKAAPLSIAVAGFAVIAVVGVLRWRASRALSPEAEAEA